MRMVVRPGSSFGEHHRLREGRALIGGVAFLAEKGDAPLVAVLAEGDGGARSRFAGADDHHPGVSHPLQPMSIMTVPASILTG